MPKEEMEKIRKVVDSWFETEEEISKKGESIIPTLKIKLKQIDYRVMEVEYPVVIYNKDKINLFPEKIVKEYFKRAGYKVWKDISLNLIITLLPNKNEKSIRELESLKKGIPDFFVINERQFFWVEVKGHGDWISDDQYKWIKKATDLGFYVLIIQVKKKDVPI